MDDRVEDRYTYGHERSNGHGEKELVRHNSFSPFNFADISFVCCLALVVKFSPQSGCQRVSRVVSLTKSRWLGRISAGVNNSKAQLWLHRVNNGCVIAGRGEQLGYARSVCKTAAGEGGSNLE